MTLGAALSNQSVSIMIDTRDIDDFPSWAPAASCSTSFSYPEGSQSESGVYRPAWAYHI
jgi:hypothetical protein